MVDQNAKKYLDELLGIFLSVLDILNDGSANSTFRNKKWRNQYGRLKL